MLQYLNEFLCSLDCNIGGRAKRDRDSLGKKFDSAGSAFGFCFADEDAVAAIMFHGGTDVPSSGSVWIPGSSDEWFFV